MVICLGLDSGRAEEISLHMRTTQTLTPTLSRKRERGQEREASPSDSLSRERERAGVRARARALRHNQTDAEAVLWSKLRRRQNGDLKFRRQHPVGTY